MSEAVHKKKRPGAENTIKILKAIQGYCEEHQLTFDIIRLTDDTSGLEYY